VWHKFLRTPRLKPILSHISYYEENKISVTPTRVTAEISLFPVFLSFSPNEPDARW
jgi:hypothetical protein